MEISQLTPELEQEIRAATNQGEPPPGDLTWWDVTRALLGEIDRLRGEIVEEIDRLRGATAHWLEQAGLRETESVVEGKK